MNEYQKKVPIEIAAIAFLAMFAVYIWIFVQKAIPLGERFLMAGAAIMFGYLFYFILAGVFSGLPKNKQKIPKKITALIISIGIVHMLIAGYLGIET